MQAALDIWVMILRFMGDMPEPKETPASPEGKGESGSGLKKLYGTIKGKFGKPKEEGDSSSTEQVRGWEGWERVCEGVCVRGRVCEGVCVRERVCEGEGV